MAESRLPKSIRRHAKARISSKLVDKVHLSRKEPGEIRYHLVLMVAHCRRAQYPSGFASSTQGMAVP